MFYTNDDLKLVAITEPDTLVVDAGGEMTLVGNNGVENIEIYTPQEFMEWRLKENGNSLDKLAKEIYESTVGMTISEPMALLDDLSSDDYNLYQLILDDYDADKIGDYLTYQDIGVVY
ncbi:hypothetical protein [Lactobacillus kalixensis]|uniref:Uncharacterized protein n=1 Tax=Lactobacillus kalixensis DSM 16043 TaxID=1423763 RepID=A0A0R1U610_9LACO|nr:hypothetical protein [Lactobacillus kalixensis]KRL88684.1 hypothetical protein FC46_GL001437 [Lactobacillus kalixensis DSM 16043]